MYRINLYRERELAGPLRRKRAVRAGVLGAVVGLEILLIALLGVSGNLLRDRARVLEGSIANLERQAGPVLDTDPQMETARRILGQRVNRIDWAGKVAAIGETIPDDVILSKIQAGTGIVKGGKPGINLEGRTVGSGSDIDSVREFLEALRQHPGISREFPVIDLETADSRQTRHFKIICRKPESTG
jgi:hypothetical protein